MDNSPANDGLFERGESPRIDTYTRTRIMLVEDDPGHIRLAKRGFGVASDRYDVTVVNSLHDARETLKLQAFDLIICELLLPDGRGTELLVPPVDVGSCDGTPTPFLLLAAQGNEQTAAQAIRAGALDYVVKSKTALLGLPRFAERALRQWQQIVARVKAERSLLFQETLWECLSEASLDGILVLSTDRECVSVNRRLFEMWKIPESEVQIRSGEHMLRSIAERLVDRTRFLAEMVEMHKDPQKTIRDEVELADHRRFERYSGPVANEGGPCFGRVWCFRDVTKQKQAEQRTQELLSQLVRVNRLSSMGEMASIIAHEMNQPLGTVANYAGTCVDLIAENRLDMSDLKRSLEKINEQCLRAGRIIGQLKRFASHEAVRRTTIDVNELVHEVKRLMVPVTNPRVEIQLELNRRVPKTLGDPIQIQQVLMNLIRNAIDAASADQCDAGIVVSTTADEREVTICVSDHRKGIPESRPEQISALYASDKTDGLGMGLSISRTIISAHGGRLWATHSENGGATIHVSLPIRSALGDSDR